MTTYKNLNTAFPTALTAFTLNTQHCESGVNFPQKESSICPPTGRPRSNSDLIVQTRATKNLQYPQHAELYPAFGGSNLQPGNGSEVPQDISRFIQGFKYDTWLIFLHYTRTQKPANNQGKDNKIYAHKAEQAYPLAGNVLLISYHTKRLKIHGGVYDDNMQLEQERKSLKDKLKRYIMPW